MPSITLHPPPLPTPSDVPNPLPSVLHTPSGLALVEIQGTLHFPPPTSLSTTNTLVGKLVFPYYDASKEAADTKWMKRVYMYVGDNQRMTGECKKLSRPVAVVRRYGGEEEMDEADQEMGGVDHRGMGDGELEIQEVVRYKIVFGGRPEPVGAGTEEAA